MQRAALRAAVEPERYIARSPALGWDNRVTFEYEKAYAAAHKDLPVVLYTSMGSLESPNEMVEPWREFVKILESRRYPGLRLTTELVEDMKHASAIGVSLVSGWKAVFSGMNLQPEALSRYIGVYHLATGDTVTIMNNAHQLMLKLNENPEFGLFAESSTRFFFKGNASAIGFEPRVDFYVGSTRNTDRVSMYQNGNPIVGLRIKAD